MSEKTKKVVKQILRYNKGITLLSVGRLVPKDWDIVEIETLKRTPNTITLKLRKVKFEVENNGDSRTVSERA
jgi:hypothetical protein